MDVVETVSNFSKTEWECAAEADYYFIEKNIMDLKGLTQQHNYISGLPRIRDMEVIPCNCQVKKGKKCIDNSCLNRLAKLCCPDSCGPLCKNSPWKNNQFVAGVKTFVKKSEEKGFGVYADADIEANEFIVEYRGILIGIDKNLSKSQQVYAFGMVRVGLLIDAEHCGSMGRLINHGCNPNCMAKFYVHNKETKIVFVSLRSISKGEELSIDYGWLYGSPGSEPTECFCGAVNCKKIIEKYIGDGDPPECATGDKKKSTVEPPIEPDDEELFTSCSTKLLLLSLQHEQRHIDYIELHKFYAGWHLYTYTLCGGTLRIRQGSFVDEYKNQNGISVVKMEVISPTRNHVYYPKWICFTHFEDAVYCLKHVFNSVERANILKYCNGLATSENANKLERVLVPEYMKQLNNDRQPKLQLVRREFKGSLAIGLSDYYLQPCRETGKATTAMETQQTKIGLSQKFVYEENRYDVKYQRELVSANQDYTTLHGLFVDACNKITELAYCRTRSNIGVNQLFRWITFELSACYNDTLLHQRRYLLFSHYELANKMEGHTGPPNGHECHLCQAHPNFGSINDLRAHFEALHSIVAKEYNCSSCGEIFSMPSLFRSHVNACDKQFALEMKLYVQSFLVDAIADFVAEKNE